MKPRSIITVTAPSLPMVLKYQDREYIIRLTPNDNLQMTKRIVGIDKSSKNTYNITNCQSEYLKRESE